MANAQQKHISAGMTNQEAFFRAVPPGQLAVERTLPPWLFFWRRVHADFDRSHVVFKSGLNNPVHGRIVQVKRKEFNTFPVA